MKPGRGSKRAAALMEFYEKQHADPHTDPAEIWREVEKKYELTTSPKSGRPDYDLWRERNPDASPSQKRAAWLVSDPRRIK